MNWVSLYAKLKKYVESFVIPQGAISVPIPRNLLAQSVRDSLDSADREPAVRHQEITDAINVEANARQGEVDQLNAALSNTNASLNTANGVIWGTAERPMGILNGPHGTGMITELENMIGDVDNRVAAIEKAPGGTVNGVWETVHNARTQWTGGIITTGIEAKGAAQYRFIISAMEGSTSGSLIPQNSLFPVLVDSVGAVVAYRIANSSTPMTMLLKAIYEGRMQISAEGGSRMFFFNHSSGVQHYSTLPNENRLNASMAAWNSETIQAYGISKRPITSGPLYWAFAQADGVTGLPDAQYQLLTKIEALGMEEEL